MYFFNYVFVDQLNGQNNGTVTPRTFHSSRMSSQYITNPGCQLPFDCCIYLENSSHLRPTLPPSLYFLMWIKNSSQTKEPAVPCTNPAPGACNRPMGRCGAKIWGYHCPTHGERGQSSWRVGWQWSILVVLCCVLCVVGLRAEY
jgi:hypothetical protein